MGWSLLEKTARSGVWLFRGALQGNSAFFAFVAFARWVEKGSFFTAWAVPPLSSCSCSYLYGRGTAIGPQTGKRCWPLLDRLWRAIAPLMKPWCAEGEVPSAANLNLYRGRSSYVGWHSDDEPLFGERGEAKAHCFSELWDPGALQIEGVSPVQAMMVAHAGLAMVTSWSWLVNVRMSSVIVRILVRIRKGLTSRSVGSNSMLPLVPF